MTRPGNTRIARIRIPRVRLAAVGTAVAATVALTQSTAAGAFSGITGDGSNSVGTAASFCRAAPSTVRSAGDSWTDESNTGLNNAGDVDLRLRSSSAGDRRVWIRFVLPSTPANCTLAQAVLSVYNKTPSPVRRTVDVYRGSSAAAQWTSTGITWANQPAGAGTPVSSDTAGVGWQTWTVTAHVAAQYSGGVTGNNGFLLQDAGENSATPYEQVYADLQNAATAPTLVLTWG